MPSSPYPRESLVSRIISSPIPNPPADNSGSSSLNSTVSHSHQVGARQATRSRTRTRQMQSSNNHKGGGNKNINNKNQNAPGPSRLGPPLLPRYNSEDHPLSAHKLAAKGYHTFQCLGIPFHVKRRYTFLRELGIGAYGCVALARDHLLDCNVAIKKVTRVFERDVLARRALREVAVLRHIGLCDNVTALLDFDTTFIEFHEIYLVLEASEADLSQIIRSGQSLSDAHLQYFVAQILRGVRYMHAANIIHRDLKPGNLLVNADCQLKLCDFGLARAYAQRDSQQEEEIVTMETSAANTNSPSLERTFPESPKDTHIPTSPKANLLSEPEEKDDEKSPEKMKLHMTELDFPGGPLTEYVATRWYRAPEIMLCFRRGYGQQIDMWAVGCILAELLGGKPIFAGQDYVDQIARINNVLGSPGAKTIAKIGSERAKKYVESLPKMPAVPFARLYPNASAAAVDLLGKLLCWDPNDRISAEEALMHPWLKAYHRSNKNWNPPVAFHRFSEVELLQSISEFRMGLEREADEMRAELAAMESEVDGTMTLSMKGKEDDKGGDSPPQSADEDNGSGNEEVRKESVEATTNKEGDKTHSPQSNRGSNITRMTRSTSSIGDSPVPTPSSLATSANETSPTYETDLTSASAPHSVSGNHSAKRGKSRLMDGLGLLAQQQSMHMQDQLQDYGTNCLKRRDEKDNSNRSQERRALDETLANHGLLCGDIKSQIDLYYDSKTSYRRRALTNAPSQRVSMRRAGSEVDLRCRQGDLIAKDDLSVIKQIRSIDITRRSILQRECNAQVTDDTESIVSWLRSASINWATRLLANYDRLDSSHDGNTTVTEETQGPGTADTIRYSPGV